MQYALPTFTLFSEIYSGFLFFIRKKNIFSRV